MPHKDSRYRKNLMHMAAYHCAISVEFKVPELRAVRTFRLSYKWQEIKIGVRALESGIMDTYAHRVHFNQLYLISHALLGTCYKQYNKHFIKGNSESFPKVFDKLLTHVGYCGCYKKYKANPMNLIAATDLVIYQMRPNSIFPFKFHKWPKKIIENPFHAPRSYVYHSIVIPEI